MMGTVPHNCTSIPFRWSRLGCQYSTMELMHRKEGENVLVIVDAHTAAVRRVDDPAGTAPVAAPASPPRLFAQAIRESFEETQVPEGDDIW